MYLEEFCKSIYCSLENICFRKMLDKFIYIPLRKICSKKHKACLLDEIAFKTPVCKWRMQIIFMNPRVNHCIKASVQHSRNSGMKQLHLGLIRKVSSCSLAANTFCYIWTFSLICLLRKISATQLKTAFCCKTAVSCEYETLICELCCLTGNSEKESERAMLI